MAFIAAQQIMIQRTTFISNATPIAHLPFYFSDDSRAPTAPERRDLVSYEACRQSRRKSRDSFASDKLRAHIR